MSYPGSSQFSMMHTEKRGNLVKLITCVTSGGMDLAIGIMQSPFHLTSRTWVKEQLLDALNTHPRRVHILHSYIIFYTAHLQSRAQWNLFESCLFPGNKTETRQPTARKTPCRPQSRGPHKCPMLHRQSALLWTWQDRFQVGTQSCVDHLYISASKDNVYYDPLLFHSCLSGHSHSFSLQYLMGGIHFTGSKVVI